ncbi:FAD-dependent oxidoreductase [Paraburkholderia oxyphila]|uniref:FAD-dependent oxidoreductase n=1 Tax=Paraburkholderia oxyphila TaxID=614212 RepID=UPI000A009FFB|nr:FAD-dependent oxidoreductase [Paraburkholderia oxyphila]
MVDVPVLVVGGGPVGLATALELQSRGIKTLVVERNPGTTRHPKMDVTNGRSMEHFRRLGVADRIRGVAVPPENCMDVSWVTRLNEWELARFHYPDVHAWRERIRNNNDGSQPLEPNMRLSQVVLEPTLCEVLKESPLVELRFGWALQSFVQDADGVTATVRETATGKTEEVRCTLLAGCDGGSSVVRESLGFSWEGNFNIAQFYMVHFRSPAKDLLQRFGIAWHYQSPLGSTLIAQDDKDIFTIHCLLPEGVDPKTIDPVQLVHQSIGTAFPLEVLQANPWSPHLVLATGYGRDRVWLAGDAVHQYIPTGGYGMNTGICDAVDVGWKFAAVLQGWGGPKLLESIEAERRAVGARNLEGSRSHMGVRFRLAKAYDPKMHEDNAEGAAAREAYGQLIKELGNAENESLGIELGFRYRESPIICAEGNEPEWDSLRYIPSTWPGVRAPHVFLNDGRAMFDLFGQWFTLLRFSDASAEPMIEAARERGVPLTVVEIRDEHARAIYERDFVLVRPDQHVAWRGDAMPSDAYAVIDRVRGA